MQKTIQDFKKLSNQGQKVFKGLFYYAYIPVIVILGLKTVDWQNFSNPQPMWYAKPIHAEWSVHIIYLKSDWFTTQ